MGASGGVVGLGTALQAEKSRLRLEFFIDNLSGSIMAQRSTQPLTEMSTTNISR